MKNPIVSSSEAKILDAKFKGLAREFRADLVQVLPALYFPNVERGGEYNDCFDDNPYIAMDMWRTMYDGGRMPEVLRSSFEALEQSRSEAHDAIMAYAYSIHDGGSAESDTES